MYNPLTCQGWSTASGWVASGGCLSARIGVVILFFIVVFMRKWVFETFGIPFNVFTGVAGSILGYILVIIIFGSFKWALLIGLILAIILGIVGAGFFGSSEDSY